MRSSWIVVANGYKARIFKPLSTKDLDEIDILVNPESREKDTDVISDRPGRSFDSMGEGRHSMEPKTTLKKAVLQKFAKRLSEYIDTARTQNKFNTLLLVVSPAFLGLLRESLDPATVKTIHFELPKDYTEKTSSEIREQLPPAIS